MDRLPSASKVVFKPCDQEYNERNPDNPIEINPHTVHVRDFQLFMKRLRNKFGSNIRFYHCGEYGEHSARPHYHACLFNFDFPDKKLWRINNNNDRLYISETLNELWPYGYAVLGDVTFQSAAYVARYCTKKITGDKAKEHYEVVDEDGVIYDRNPEYATMSRRPGIGATWFKKYGNDVYPKDFVTVNGKRVKPPKYYDNQLQKYKPFMYDEVKENRERRIDKNDPEYLEDRLRTKEEIQRRRMNRLVRNHDKEGV